MMTDAEITRLISALVTKWEGVPLADPGDRISHATLEGIIGTTVVDVLLVAGGAVTLDDCEPYPPVLPEADPEWIDPPAKRRWWRR